MSAEILDELGWRGLIAQSTEHVAMVRQLEEQYEADDPDIVTESDIPSGDEIAEELERYLRGETP